MAGGRAAVTAPYDNLLRNWFSDIEARFSRFQPDSELSAINRAAGKWTPISPMMSEVLALALNYWD